MALLIFTITIFVSAFLLFLVQPIIGKLILPKLGGTPQVWNTCMVFFQSALLLGYAYTHSVSTRLKLRQQLMLHGGLLIVPILMMLLFPIYATVQGWPSLTEGNPIFNTLVLLALIVGVPFFVVSTSAPLLQKWFGYSGDPTAKDPYFLYSASNAGSLLSLFFYPILIEPFTELSIQSYIWLVGYILLAALVMYCIYTIYKLAPPDSEILAAAAAEAAPAPLPETPAPAPAPAAESSTAVKSGPAPGAPSRGIQRKKGMKLGGKPEEDQPTAREPVLDNAYGAKAEMTWFRRIRWVMLAFVPSSLMLGVTSYVSTDLSPFPLLWIIPLTLYLLSFILVYLKFWTGKTIVTFSGHGYTVHDAVIYLIQPFGILTLCFVVMGPVFGSGFDPIKSTLGCMLGFFANALGCHGELAKDRPATRYLTEYFLMMSIGGMLGGVFNGILAPLFFQRSVLEFNIAVAVACYVRPQYVVSGWLDELIFSVIPSFQNWVRNQGDEMAKSMGRPAPRSTYLFNVFLDILFGAFILFIGYWLADRFGLQTREGEKNLVKFAKFLSLPIGGAEYLQRILVFFVPGVFCFFFGGRPLRMGLAVTGLLVGSLYFAAPEDTRTVLEARRTYFGLLRVSMSQEQPRDPEEAALMRSKNSTVESPPYPFTFLMHGTTYHGRNYKTNAGDKFGKDRVDLSRLATTYYHRYGPVGVVMEQYNWWSRPDKAAPLGSTPGRQNDFTADARMPVALVGQIAAEVGIGNFPLATLVETWSEPPYATIGLGTGTMASYSRPYQCMTYYEIDEVIRGFSLPDDNTEAHFTYLQNAIRRGTNLEVIMGDARLSLEPLREPKNLNNSLLYWAKFGGPKGPVFQPPEHSSAPDRQQFYKVINVDAFSSDAIPIHLVTKQAIKIYMDKLTDDGVLCVHTSNRHMDLVRPVARIALELSKEAEKEGLPEINCMVGKDLGDRERYMGHFTSEYVMIYRGTGFSDYLKKLEDKKAEFVKDNVMKAISDEGERPVYGRAPAGWQILNANVEWYNPYTDHGAYRRVNGRVQFVKTPVVPADAVWTDDYSYIPGVIRWPWQ